MQLALYQDMDVHRKAVNVKNVIQIDLRKKDVAKRVGRTPRGEFAGKSEVMSVRIRPDTKKRLVTAAEASGRSPSQEFEHRLRRTFDDDDGVGLVYGDRKTKALMELMGAAIRSIQNFKNSKADWTEDSYLFNQARIAVNGILDLFQPIGAPEGADDSVDSGPHKQGLAKAKAIVQDMWTVDAAKHIAKSTKRERMLSAMRNDLGTLADRSTINGYTAEKTREIHDLGVEFNALLKKQTDDLQNFTEEDWKELHRIGEKICKV